LSTENQSLAARNAVLMAEVQDLKSGTAAIEEHAREEMGMIKQNEVFYQIVEKSIPNNKDEDENITNE
jgi:cell division protein FtsB